MDAWDAAGVAVVAATAAASLVILFLAPGRATNRLLALVLFMDVVAWRADIVVLVLRDPASAHAATALMWAAGAAVTPLYLLFLGSALDAPLTRPLKLRPVRAALWALSLALPVIFLAYLPTWRAYDLVVQFSIANVPMGLAYLFGLVASLSAVAAKGRTALERRRAIAFALAFGVRDALQVPFLLSAALLLAYGEWMRIAITVSEVAVLVFLSYGILQAQLLGIDVRIKGTLRQGSVAAAFLAAFFVASQLVEAVATQALGYAAGAALAGLMLFALRPIERAAGRLADAAMSGVKDTPEYFATRRQDIYRAAVQDSLVDGSVSAKERQLLLRLAQNLGLDGNDAMRIEGEVLAGHAAR